MSKDNPAGCIDLCAPLSGIVVPIERVPDPVFAQKLVGDGISIDPTSSTLVAPCEGTVIQIHPCGHAVTLNVDGVELLMHIGLDTVHLKGEGFKPLVKVGDRVLRGDSLIEFDPDLVATRAKSLLTLIIVTSPERLDGFRAPGAGVVQAGAGRILSILRGKTSTAAEPQAAGDSAPAITSEPVTIINQTGLHARPAAVLVQLARRFKSEILLRRGDGKANAKSVVSIMSLDVRKDDQITIVASGADAQEAVAAIVPELKTGLGEKAEDAPTITKIPGASEASIKPATATSASATGENIVQTNTKAMPQPGDPKILVGVAASPGCAVGKIRRLGSEAISFKEVGESPHIENRRLEEALEQARIQLDALHDRLTGAAEAGKAAIFAAHGELLGDPDVLDVAWSAIAKGKSAASAWNAAFVSQAERLAALENKLLAARATDLRDVGRRVLRLLTGATETAPVFPEETILVAEDLTPSDAATLDRGKILGFCTVAGGATSHVAILARSFGIPAIAAIEPRVLDIPDETIAILDGDNGTLRLDPAPSEIEIVKKQLLVVAERRKTELASATGSAVTKDGARIFVVANIGNAKDAEEAVKMGGEGVGLLRSEFLFFDRSTPPTEDEQAQVYETIARTLGPDRPLTIRTLDVGGDKPLAYLPIPREENPFLGERGIRISLDRPEMFRTQLRAILRASRGYNVQIMFPMIASLDEWRAAKSMLDEEAARLKMPAVPAGIMVEVPSAALLAELFAPEVAFFSIGTNDLTQYTLAMDRGHPKMAPHIDGLHPAVLRLIACTAEAAARHGKSVSVCGGLAGDFPAVPLLIGLGINKLSVSVPAIPGVKALVRRLRGDDVRALAAKALTLDGSAAARALGRAAAEA